MVEPGGSQSSECLIPFEDDSGRTVFHCHILDHEALGLTADAEVT